MRNIKTTDLFSLSRILKKMDLKEELKTLDIDLESKDKTEIKNSVLIEVMYMFLENMGSAEEEIFKFVSLISEVKEEELKDNPDLFVGNLKEILFSEGFSKLFPSALH